MGVFSAMEHTFNETAMHAKAQASNRVAKANRASHGPRVSPSLSDNGKSKEDKGKPKGKSKGTKSANQGCQRLTRTKHRKSGLSGLGNSKSETQL